MGGRTRLAARRTWPVTALIGLAVAVLLPGCGVSASGAIEVSPVWAADGNVYYLHNVFDGDQELWRRAPDGSKHSVAFDVPAEVLQDARCDANDIANYHLFRWPEGQLGVDYSCGTGQGYFYTYTSQPVLHLVRSLPAGGPVAWQDNGSTGYLTTSSCFGTSKIIGGAIVPFATPVHIAGGVDPLTTDGETGPCAATGVGLWPVAAGDGSYWAFLFAPHADKKDQVGLSSTVLSVYVWRRGQTQPQPVGQPIAGAGELALDEQRGIVAVTAPIPDGDEVRLVSLDTGQQLTVIDGATFPAFSPDGSQIVYTNSDHKLSTADVPNTP